MKHVIILCFCAVLTACGGGGGDEFFSSRPTLQRLIITPAQEAVPAGSSVKVSAIAVYSDGKQFDVTSGRNPGAGYPLISLRWSVMPSNLDATISADTVTTSKPGDLTIQASDFFSSVIGTGSLKVTAPLARSLSISGLRDQQTVSSRTSMNLESFVIRTDGSSYTPSAVSWTSSNNNIATIDSTGKFTAKAAGSTLITAMSEGMTKNISVTVVIAQSTPTFVVNCDMNQSTVINASTWNSKYSSDNVNATEWIGVDGSSCQSYPVVLLLIPSTNSSNNILYYTLFVASRDPNDPTNFLPGTTYGTTSGGQFDSGQKLTIGWKDRASNTSFTSLYELTAQ